eukprot:7384326-Prymnesium_polylepis.1
MLTNAPQQRCARVGDDVHLPVLSRHLIVPRERQITTLARCLRAAVWKADLEQGFASGHADTSDSPHRWWTAAE